MSEIPAPKHLPLQHRKVLSGRLRVLEAMSAHELDFSRDQHGYAFGKLSAEVLDRIARAPGRTDDSIQLDQFLRIIGSQVDSIVDYTAAGDDDQLGALRSLALPIHSQLTDIDCQNCVGGDGQPVCNGMVAIDNPIVHQGGDCLQPIKQLFGYVRDETAAWYTQFGAVDIATLQAVDVTLSTTVLGHDPNFSGCRYASAATNYHDDNTGRRASEIQLAIQHELLDMSTFLCVPYLLFHELVCHAWQGIRALTFPVESRHTRPNDYFAEGWMDYVAYRVFEHAVQGKCLTDWAGLRSEHETPSRFVHEERFLRNLDSLKSLTPAGYNDEVYRRARLEKGVKTAVRFERFLRDHLRSNVAQQAFFRLSFGLCLENGMVHERQDFVCTLDPIVSALLPTSARRELRSLFDKLLQENDMRTFLKEWAAWNRFI